jgi:Nif-specific regulatory protein
MNPQNPNLEAMQQKIRELQLLYDISCALNRNLRLEELLQPVLKQMAAHMDLLRGTITILNREANELEIDLSYGLSSEEQSRGRYRLGEGVTGQVVASGTPAIVKKVSEEPLFLDRTRTRQRERHRHAQDLSFICVPIRIGTQTIGALSADRLFGEDVALEELVRLLTIISSMIAHTVEIRREAREKEKALRDEQARLRLDGLDRFKPVNIIGNSHAMAQVYRLISQVAPSRATVLIRGESGVGKELVAEAIHANSPCAGKPFIKVNMAALPENLIESELFGHERGAFTGAIADRKGRFELAAGGTLFLDEIGDLPPAVQVKLLRVLQEKTFERVGSNTPIQAEVRVLTATNRNLEALIEKERFRADLYYRINVFPIFIPPLRERKTDITLLADYFAERAARKYNKQIHRITTPAIDMLMSYHWPGNVRELENCIERAVLLSHDRVIHSHHLPPSLQTAESSGTAPQGVLEAAVKTVEYELIADALKAAQGNRAAAARLLGISERLIGLRIRKHGISVERFKN